MDGGNASCSLLLDLSRVLPLSRALLNFPRLVFELWGRRDLCLPLVLFATLRIRNITCVISMPRLDLSPLVVPLSAVLPPLRAVQPLERYYGRRSGTTGVYQPLSTVLSSLLLQLVPFLLVGAILSSLLGFFVCSFRVCVQVALVLALLLARPRRGHEGPCARLCVR